MGFAMLPKFFFFHVFLSLLSQSCDIIFTAKTLATHMPQSAFPNKPEINELSKCAGTVLVKQC